MYKLLLLLLLCCVPAAAQEIISGYVYDDEQKPLEAAYVYLDGTTVSASTNEKGYFCIQSTTKYNAPLMVSFVGFETLRVDDPFQYKGKNLKLYLRTAVTELDEVVISNKPLFTRKQMLKVFREQFLGRSKAGRNSRIENEGDIYLTYDEQDHILKAKCRTPIRVVNRHLEYKLLYNLVSFEVKYNTNTLDEAYLNQSFYAGTSSFTDVSVRNSADKKRKQAYLGSVTHLMHTIKDNDWERQKFTLYAGSTPVQPGDYLKVSDTLGIKKVTLNTAAVEEALPKAGTLTLSKGPLKPRYTTVTFNLLRQMDTRTQSGINFQADVFYIDNNGLFFPIDALLFRGYMGTLKVGDLLPVDYVYVP